MDLPKIASREEWLAAQKELNVKETELTRQRDALAAERRKMPMVEVEKEYVFEGPDGEARLLDLFDGRRQLIVYSFFFEPGVEGWPEAGCVGCSLFVDNIGQFALSHLRARDTSLVLASHAPQANIERYKKRMEWRISWLTTLDDFSGDFGVTEWLGMNVFIRDGGHVFRTYFVNGREVETMGNAWSLLDLTPLGRQEEWEDSPEGRPQTPDYTWRRHDEYDDA